ncbi:MAG: ABC transporter ATP-binding protein [Planctomycetes bacterium]|nr:ABC transporter ATP-binding protein [Planctomycetota bacterium]
MPAAVSLYRVTKRYGSQTALDDVSLEVPRGVVFALLGENGAGKTTTIKLLLGLDEADAGRLDVLGLDSRKQGAEVRQQVGYVPEQPTLYEWMTAAEIGWFTAGFYAGSFEHQYLTLLQQFSVPADRKIKQMSKGMRAKVALSLALAHQPELLILDEPTSGLDTLVRREFLESMVDIAAAGRTVLLSSHLINEVERVADVVAIMREGRLLVVESLDTLKCQTQELTITVAAGSTGPPALPGQILSSRRRSRQWQVLARNLPESAIDALRDHESIVAVETRTPGLEEIFVAYMQGGNPVAALGNVGNDAEPTRTGNIYH